MNCPTSESPDVESEEREREKGRKAEHCGVCEQLIFCRHLTIMIGVLTKRL